MSPFFSESKVIPLHKPLVLASRSPRRRQLLEQVGLNPLVAPCELPEVFDPERSPHDNAIILAHAKAECVARSYRDAVILAADTIVVVDHELLAKPIDEQDAIRMLTLLSGRTHEVYTGFALLDRPSGLSVDGVERTAVTFRSLPPDEIARYVTGGSPMDKAGAYGIQDDYGAVFVTRVEGCYYNVVGLPLARVYIALLELSNKVGHAERA